MRTRYNADIAESPELAGYINAFKIPKKKLISSTVRLIRKSN